MKLSVLWLILSLFSLFGQEKLIGSNNLSKKNLNKNPNKSLPKMEVYFTPNSADGLDSPYRQLTNLISIATKDIYLVAYGFNLSEVVSLLIAKKHEGVEVEVLLEKDSLEELITRHLVARLREAGVKVYLDNRNSGIMHNKFLVVDRQVTLTGSANFTLNGYFHHYNDVVVINSRSVAQRYLRKFVELIDPTLKYRWRRRGVETITVDLSYLVDKQDKQDKQIEEETVKILFSRSGEGILEEIGYQINQTKKQLQFMIFAFSSLEINEKMINLLKRRNQIGNKQVSIKGIFDNSFESESLTRNWRTVPFQTLWLAGADVKYDNESEKVHHKNIQIDDSRVLTGSFNFSQNAYKNNDENLLIINSSRISKEYGNRFEELWRRFPSKTLFERYIIAINKGKKKKNFTKITYSEYLSILYGEEQKVVEKILNGGDFKTRVRRVLSGDLVELEIKDRMKTYKVTVSLFGVKAPIKGIISRNHEGVNHKGVNHERVNDEGVNGVPILSQEPHASQARELLARWVVGRELRGRLVRGGRDKDKSKGRSATSKVAPYFKDYKVLLFTESRSNKKINKSINHRLLASGAVFLNQQDMEWVKRYKKRGLNGFVLASEKGKSSGQYLYNPNLKKLVLPISLVEGNIEEYLINAQLLEQRESLVKYQIGSLIGDRKTKKAYLPKSSGHREREKHLEDVNLIFFAQVTNATAAGYRVIKD